MLSCAVAERVELFLLCWEIGPSRNWELPLLRLTFGVALRSRDTFDLSEAASVDMLALMAEPKSFAFSVSDLHLLPWSAERVEEDRSARKKEVRLPVLRGVRSDSRPFLRRLKSQIMRAIMAMKLSAPTTPPAMGAAVSLGVEDIPPPVEDSSDWDEVATNVGLESVLDGAWKLLPAFSPVAGVGEGVSSL